MLPSSNKMEENKHILFDNYLNGSLKPSEKQAFESELQTNAVLAEEFKVFKALVAGIKQHEKQALKATLVGVEAAVLAKGLSSYKPTNNPPGGGGGSGAGGGNIAGKFLSWVSGLTFVAAAVSGVLIYLDKFPVEHPLVDKVEEQFQQIEQQLQYEYTVDTVIRVIEVPAGSLNGNDSIVIYENELNGKSVEEYVKEKQSEGVYD